jgi:hypothetical protein
VGSKADNIKLDILNQFGRMYWNFYRMSECSYKKVAMQDCIPVKRFSRVRNTHGKI